MVEVSGEMQMEGQVELEEKMKPDVKSRQRKGGEEYLPLDCYKQARIALEMMKTNQEGKTGYEEVLEEMRRKEKEVEAQVEAMEQEIERKNKESGRKIQEENKLERRRSKLFDSNEDVNEGEESFDKGKWDQGRQKGTLRPLAAQLPILIKGAQGQYVPWASQDLEGLVTRLPDIHEGAGKWIRVFEEETMGKLLAVGDIKALLAKTVGGAKMEEILQTASLDRAVNSHNMDGIIFDVFRPAVWQALRAECPIRLDPKSLKGDELKETENPTTYFQRQLKRWKQETEGNPETDPLMATLLRQAVIDAMPPAVKCRLEDVVGLNSKTHKEFCDHVSHAVEQFRKNEQKLKNQEKELQRKLTQLQLEELTKKNKKKIQASVKKEEAEQMSVMSPELCSLAMATALDDATVNSLFWIGANYYHPVDLADTTGLNWREEILWCQETHQPTQSLANPEPSQPTPRLAEPEPRATEPSPMGVTVLSSPTRCESRPQCSRRWMFQTAPPTAPLRLSLELSACLDFPPTHPPTHLPSLCYLLLSALLPQSHHRCPLTAPLLTLSPPSSPSASWLEDPSPPPPASESWTLTRPFDPVAPPRLSAPSSPPSPVGPPAPPGSIIPPAAPWSVVVPPSPQDSTPPAAPRRSVPPAPLGSSSLQLRLRLLPGSSLRRTHPGSFCLLPPLSPPWTLFVVLLPGVHPPPEPPLTLTFCYLLTSTPLFFFFFFLLCEVVPSGRGD
ncbi:hypothetical protein M9458_052040 [Cirrhinus mrigala]|uniref:Uncharacterized protein n=1 Tax=Cirrhinus mrigala TaxID=683832 RepID=A0ABD0MT48_CIRMR